MKRSLLQPSAIELCVNVGNTSVHFDEVKLLEIPKAAD